MNQSIDNFSIVESCLDFNGENYYMFSCLSRKKDGISQKDTTHKVWLISSIEEFHSKIEEMKSVCNLFGGRIYFSINSHSFLKSMFEMQDIVTENIRIYCENGTSEPIINRLKKSLKGMICHIGATANTVDKSAKQYVMYDVDTKDKSALNDLVGKITESYVEYSGDRKLVKDMVEFAEKITVLESCNGFHVLAPRKFNVSAKPLQNLKDIELKINSLALAYTKGE